MHHYYDVEWRFSGIRATFYGCDPLVCLAFPAIVLGLSQELAAEWFLLVAIYSAICAYASYFTPHDGLVDWLNAQRTRWLQRCRWPV